MDRIHIDYMEQYSGDSRITIGLRHMSRLNIGDFYLKSFDQNLTKRVAGYKGKLFRG